MTSQSGLSENVAGLLCYLVGWITGLIFFFIDKRPYVRYHAAQSIVVFGALQILVHILGMFFGVGIWFGGFGGWTGFGLGILLIELVNVVAFILWIVCMIKAYQGERFKVPVAGDFAQKLAGS